MKIVVCVKQVPDSAASILVENGTVSWPEAALVVNPWDEFAIEAALALKDKLGGEVIAVSFSPETAREALKSALAMGCTGAALIHQVESQPVDGLFTARILAAAVQKLGGVDLVILGRQSIDTDLGTTPAQVARLLGWPILSLVSSIQTVDPSSKKIQVERAFEEGRQVLESRLPAVLSVVKDIGKPRYPSFMNIRKAQTMPIQCWSVADLGLSLGSSSVRCVQMQEPPRRQVTTEMIPGETAEEIAANLLDRILVEKVL